MDDHRFSWRRRQSRTPGDSRRNAFIAFAILVALAVAASYVFSYECPTAYPAQRQSTVARKAVGPDDVLMSVDRLGVFESPPTSRGPVPDAVLYRNGDLYVRDHHTGGPIASMLRTTLSADQVSALMFMARGIAIVPEDLGQPRVTDIGSTKVTVQLGSRAIVRSAWALGFVNTGALSAKQVLARRYLAWLVSLPTAAGAAGSPWTPDRIVVHRPATQGPNRSLRPWPLATAPSTQCTILRGEDAQLVLRAIGPEPAGSWYLGEAVFGSTLTPELPGRAGC